MSRMRGSWFAAALVPAVLAGVVYLQAGAQTVPERQPLITEALVDAENGTLTINGFDFAGETPTVTLGMTTLPVLSLTETGVVTGLPEVLPGTYLLALSWADGAGAVFYPTLGAVGPAGPQGPQGEPGPFLSAASTTSAGAMASGAAVAGGDPARQQDHAGRSNTHYGDGALANRTTGNDNSAFGQQALHNLTTGKDNAAFGRLSMRDMISGEDNLAIGTQAMLRSTTASFNMAFGSGALENNDAGVNNVAIGSAALLTSQGDNNIAIGRNALRLNTDGSGNTAIGYQAGNANRTGSNNVYIGAAGEDGEEGVIRIGNPNTHTRTILVGEVEGDIKVVPVYQ